MSVNMDEEELYSRVHTSERPRRRGHPAPPREEKVLSRSIMQKVPATESPKTPAPTPEARKSEEGEKKSGVEEET